MEHFGLDYHHHVTLYTHLNTIRSSKSDQERLSFLLHPSFLTYLNSYDVSYLDHLACTPRTYHKEPQPSRRDSDFLSPSSIYFYL